MPQPKVIPFRRPRTGLRPPSLPSATSRASLKTPSSASKRSASSSRRRSPKPAVPGKLGDQLQLLALEHPSALSAVKGLVDELFRMLGYKVTSS